MAQLDEDTNVQPEPSYAESTQEHRMPPVKEKAGPYLSSQKERLVEQLQETAGALRETGTKLTHDFSSRLARTSAQKIDELGGYLGVGDIDDLLDELQEFARSRPWLVIGAAFVAGLAAARFLKASGRQYPIETGTRRAGF